MSTLGHGVFRRGSTPQDLMYSASSGSGGMWGGGGGSGPMAWATPDQGPQPLTPTAPSPGPQLPPPASSFDPVLPPPASSFDPQPPPSGGGGGMWGGGGGSGPMPWATPDQGLVPLTPSGPGGGGGTSPEAPATPQAGSWAAPSWRVGGGETQTGADAPYWSSGKIFQPMTMTPGEGVGNPATGGWNTPQPNEGLGNPATGGWNTPPSGEALGNPATGGWGGSSGGMNVPQLGGVKV